MDKENVDRDFICPQCKQNTLPGATRCGHCGVLLNKTRRTLLQLSALASAILVIVPLWQVAVSTTDLFKRTVDFEIEASSCTRDRFTVSFVNLEKDRVLTWNQARLISIDGEQLEATMTFPGYQRRHVPPLSATLIVFNIESKIIDNMIKLDEGISNIRIVMSVNATDADGTKETSKSTICVYSDARTSLN